ncbi:mannitol-1-phosphate 5-dehydrogenase [Paenibacillus soyae]|uniref:Mannitol-1-phosphate 5-dehydrogenase n=1 Tax=Paenibacillus soyae TaxID=2969249 RepID=A0A9X2MWD6_9BACL|nr:mannitol-1-phosphate 5-dehydrogenase [Paenibacillus soyae]MCR2807655.1 mannitol-1-phosphate 5-dehydrogenase [Paenibacillus soyae]
MIAVHFGAGNIGLGFIGLLLSQSGYSMKFVDVNADRVALINERGEYRVRLANEEGETLVVKGASAINGRDIAQVAQAIAEADIVTTAVGVGALPYLAEAIAEGIKLRMTAGAPPIPFIACENAIGGSTILKGHVMEKLAPELRDQAARAAAFPDAAVDRIVPIQQNDDELLVTVEPFYEWIVDRTALPAGFPELQGVLFVDKLEPYIERKLFTVNTGHASTAYAGYRLGYETIQEAMKDEAVVSHVRTVLGETGAVLVRQHGLDQAEHDRYIVKILDRFRNPYLTDEVVRVGRSPIRKLSPNDRLVRPALLAQGMGIETPGLVRAIAEALAFDSQEDQEAMELQNALREQGLLAVITKYTGIEADHPLYASIVLAYERIHQGQEA